MGRHHRRTLALALAVSGAVLVGVGTIPTAAANSTGVRSQPALSLGQWLERQAVAAPTDPAAVGADLAQLGRLTGGATVVGLGEAAHGLAEVTRAKSRAVRYLVAQRGYRTVAWEDDWTLGIQINDYIRDSYFVDLTGNTPPAVRSWLDRPMLTRGVPEAGPGSTMSGGTPRQWYDALVHVQRVTASAPLTAARPLPPG
ncbi:hypothetical protein O7626_17865 [Micromonospora sp. WMMD1102]|uniref:hypothetical protein n=1 Tax=Micromonospora sp. WMMD1102 TaxID=3016105 RepID=UPI00241537B4|nr:hypothetical protein [Micromonospora sp. WMMD1102]MDG4787781.1 hypothetical protein [Micromonospora sp. WMMD1102]